MKNYKGVANLDQLLDLEHGNVGSKKRNAYEEGAQIFIIHEMLKDARKAANMTQRSQRSPALAARGVRGSRFQRKEG